MKTLALLLLLAAPLAAQPIPTNCPEWTATAAILTFDQGNGFLYTAGVAGLSKECSEARWGVNYAQHGYLHSTDHLYALRCVLDREPSFLEVYDSWVRGSANIDAAARKCGSAVASLYGCLTGSLGAGNGSRIYDRIFAGEVGLVKGRYAGRDYDCSAYPLPNGTPPPKPPLPPVDPPKPPEPACPPTPPACNPAPIPQAVMDTLKAAQGWAFIGKGRAARLGEALGLLMGYQPCIESTGQNVVVLK
jgi:hypothetical protein